MKTVAIVIVNFNGEQDTTQCLESVEKLQISNYKLQIIVVDNGSREKLRVDLPAGKAGSSKLKVGELKIIRNEENLGFTGGNNVGMLDALASCAHYIMLLNNDTIVDKNLVSELLKALETDESIGIVAPKIYFAPGFEYHKTRYKPRDQGKVIWYAGGVMDWDNLIGHHRGVDEVDHGQYDAQEKTDFASGCCMMIKNSVLTKIGLFDERYFLYYEESDLCERVKRAGYKILFAPRAVLWHKNAQTAGGSGSVLQDYYITRNRLLFGIKYASLRTKFALLREGIQLLLNGRKWQKIGARDYFLKRFGKGSYRVEK